MLRLASVRVESLCDDVLPDEVRALPDDLAALDELLSDAALLAPIEQRWQRFRPRAARIDSTVVEADIRYPTDSGLAADGVKALAREGRKLAAKIGAKRTAVRDRSRAAGRRLRALTRSMRRRSGQAKEE